MFLFLIIPAFGLLYVLWHVWCVLPWPAVWRWVAVVACASCVVPLVLTMSRFTDKMPMWCATLFYEIGTSLLFVTLYLFVIFLLLDILRVTGVMPRALLFSNGITTFAIFLATAGIFLCGNMHYNNKTRREIMLSTNKNVAGSVRMVLMSDLHLGYNNRRKELARWVDMVNAERPDIILVGGDIIDMSVRPLAEEGMAEELRRLNAPVYACLGNHEYYCGVEKAADFYKSAGITLLRDSVATAGDLCIIGRDDRTNKRRKPLDILVKNADTSRFTILLDHQPFSLEQAERAGIDFLFSGHTHHGQVFPISLITEAIYEVAYGYYRRGATIYYVSSGIGIWGGKYRIGTCSEYVVATVSGGKNI